MRRSQRLYCKDIIERIERIEAYTDDGLQAYSQSMVNQDAVIYCFTVIGEAIKQLDEDLTAQQTHIDWRGFAEFRDILIHQYHGTDLKIVWQASPEDLPLLKTAVRAILSSLDDGEPMP